MDLNPFGCRVPPVEFVSLGLRLSLGWVRAYLIDSLAVWNLAKELVHTLKTASFGLRNEEPSENEHAEAECPVNEVCSIATFADSGDHVWGSTSNNEVEPGRQTQVSKSVSRGHRYEGSSYSH